MKQAHIIGILCISLLVGSWVAWRTYVPQNVDEIIKSSPDYKIELLQKYNIIVEEIKNLKLQHKFENEWTIRTNLDFKLKTAKAYCLLLAQDYNVNTKETEKLSTSKCE